MKICVYLIGTSEALESVEDIYRRKTTNEIEPCILYAALLICRRKEDALVVICPDT